MIGPSTPLGISGRALPSAVVLALVLSCGPTEDVALKKTGTLSGSVTSDLSGDAWLFLFAPGKGPPTDASAPKYVTAVSAERRVAGDTHFVFAEVNANPYRLWGFLDTNRNFRADVDVLAQPGAFDRVTDGVDVNVQPARGEPLEVPLAKLVVNEPPAFELLDVKGDLALDAPMGGVTSLQIVSADVATFDSRRTVFSISLVDADKNGIPDDADGDNVPDVSLRGVLLWKPKPGQLAEGSRVIVPVVFNVAPFLTTLNGKLDQSVSVKEVQLFVVPQAQEVVTTSDGKTELRPFGSPPPGAYELVLTSNTGQFWKVPNQLAAELPSQGVQLHFDRAVR